MTDYKLRFECAADLMHAIIRESNEKNDIISHLKTEIRQLKEQLYEIRYNPYHDPENGRFTSANGVDISDGSGIIKAEQTKKTRSLKIGKVEARKISSEISTNYRRYADKKICYHYSIWKDTYYEYKFINNGFADYTFIRKRKE